MTSSPKARSHATTERRVVAQLVVVDLLKRADLTASEIYRATARINVTRASIVRAILTLTKRGRIGNRDDGKTRTYFLRTWR